MPCGVRPAERGMWHVWRGRAGLQRGFPVHPSRAMHPSDPGTRTPGRDRTLIAVTTTLLCSKYCPNSGALTSSLKNFCVAFSHPPSLLSTVQRPRTGGSPLSRLTSGREDLQRHCLVVVRGEGVWDVQQAGLPSARACWRGSRQRRLCWPGLHALPAAPSGHGTLAQGPQRACRPPKNTVVALTGTRTRQTRAAPRGCRGS